MLDVQEITGIEAKDAARECLWFLSHHKCGTTWFNNILTTLADLNGLSYAVAFDSSNIPRDVDICFIANAEYSSLPPIRSGKALHVVRNPMSIVTSAYFSHRNSHETQAWAELLEQRQILQDCSQLEGLYLTLAYLERAAGAPLYDLNRWDYGDPNIMTVQFEDLVSRPNDWLAYIAEHNDAQFSQYPNPIYFSFERATGGRKLGEVDPNSHYRSGSPDAWREELPKPIVRYIRTHYRGLLEGYYPEALQD
jgi:Sulfotransferase domain